MLSRTTTTIETKTITNPGAQYVMKLDARSDIISVTVFHDDGTKFEREFPTLSAPNTTPEQLAGVRAFCDALVKAAMVEIGFLDEEQPA